MATTGSFTLNRDALEKLVNSPSGQVAKYLAVQGRRVETQARRLATNQIVNVDTGRLSGAISSALATDSKGLFVKVLCNVEYAAAVHEGTVAHPIVGRNSPRKVLRFPSGGGIVYAKRVNHPGTDPRPFLRLALNVLKN